MKLKTNNIEDIVSKVKGISFEEACEHPLVKEINEVMQEYVNKRIEDAFGDTFIMGSANGGLMLEMDIDNVIDVGENGDEWIETPLP